MKVKAIYILFLSFVSSNLRLAQSIDGSMEGETHIKYESLISTVEVFKLDQVCKLESLYSSSLLFEVSKFSMYTD